MKQTFFSLLVGIIIGLTGCACSIANGHITTKPMSHVLTERGYINTTVLTTEEGTYRIFIAENRDPKTGGMGIAAIKIK